jgi:tetratricopeptide (TPR) repeat protein
MALKVKTDHVLRKKVPGSSIIYLPTGKFLRYVTFGYSGLAADMIYLWAIQYYSDPAIVDRFQYLDHIFSIINELDPSYVDPYEIGALIAGQEAKDMKTAFKILDRGLEKNPDQWIFPFEAGHMAQMIMKDFNLAGEYFKKTMAIPGSPDFVKRLYANSLYKVADYKSSWETWFEIYNTAPDERVKKIASNHLYQVKAAVDTKSLSQAVANFKERFGLFPADLDELARAGFLTAIPKDLDGKDYVYEPKSGEVKAPTIPWKR